MDWKNHLTPNEGGELERAQIARDAARAAYNDERLRLKWKGETRARRRAPPGARASWRSELSEADLAGVINTSDAYIGAVMEDLRFTEIMKL